MASGVEERAKTSAEHFRDIVWPEIKHWFDAEKVVPVEDVTDSEMADNLDTLAGIDAWAIDPDKSMFGIGSRVQIQSNIKLPWWMLRTHTVRKTPKPGGMLTEFQKRVQAIDDDDLYPKFTVQAYLDVENGEVQNVAAVRTEPLMEFIQHGVKKRHYYVRDAPTGETFYVVHWPDLEEYLSNGGFDSKIVYYNQKRREKWHRLSVPDTVPSAKLSDFYE